MNDGENTLPKHKQPSPKTGQDSPETGADLDPKTETIDAKKPGPFKIREIGPGDEFGDFEIIKLLGKGGMGAVYLAKDRRLDREVALKLPIADEGSGSYDLKRFLQEARSAAKLNHPGLCSIYEVGDYQGQPFLCLEYVEGKSLDHYLKPGKPLKPDTAAKLAKRIADAVYFAHERGVIHRDLKPANVMVNKQKQPIVMDFGLARIEQREEDTRLTQTGMIMGTPAYMAPEQIGGVTKEIDAQSDVYSMGVMLYEMLAGVLPFRGKVHELMRKVLIEEPPKLSEVNAEVPTALERIVQKAMAKTKTDRYASMADFSTDLRKYVEGNGQSLAAADMASPAENEVPVQEQGLPPGEFESVFASFPAIQQPTASPLAKAGRPEKKLNPVVLIGIGASFAMIMAAFLGFAAWMVLAGSDKSDPNKGTATNEIVAATGSNKADSKSKDMDENSAVADDKKDDRSQARDVPSNGLKSPKGIRDTVGESDKETESPVSPNEVAINSFEELKEAIANLQKPDSSISRLVLDRGLALEETLSFKNHKDDFLLSSASGIADCFVSAKEKGGFKIESVDDKILTVKDLKIIANVDRESPLFEIEGQVRFENCVIVGGRQLFAFRNAQVVFENCQLWQQASGREDSNRLTNAEGNCTIVIENGLVQSDCLVGCKDEESVVRFELKNSSIVGGKELVQSDTPEKCSFEFEQSLLLTPANRFPDEFGKLLQKKKSVPNLSGSIKIIRLWRPATNKRLNGLRNANLMLKEVLGKGTEVLDYGIEYPVYFDSVSQKFLPKTGYQTTRALLEHFPEFGVNLDDLPMVENSFYELLDSSFQCERQIWNALIANETGKLPRPPKLFVIEANGNPKQDFLDAFNNANSETEIQICTNAPIYLSPGEASIAGLQGAVTIRAGEGYRPLFSRNGNGSGVLLKVNGRSSTNQPSALRLEGITFADNGPAQRDYRRSVLVQGVNLEAESCIFIEAYGAVEGVYPGPAAVPQIRLRNCFFFHLPLKTDITSVSCKTGSVYVENCLAIRGRFLINYNSGNQAGENTIAINKSTFIGTDFVSYSSGQCSNFLQFKGNVVSDGIHLFGVDSNQSKFSQRYTKLDLSGNAYFRLQHPLWPETSGFASKNGSADSSQAVRLYRRLVGGQDADSSFRSSSIFNRQLVELTKQRIVPPQSLKLAGGRRKQPGCNVDTLPELPLKLMDVYPANVLPPRSMLPRKK